jgi:acetolactate synthase regulatory subunit
MTNFFSTLPDSLILNLLSEWVYAADVGRLDSALCKELERENFLRVARSPHCVLHPSAGVTSQGQFTNWLFKRQFSTSALDVSALLKQNCLVRSRYVKQRGHHVRTVNISSASTSTDAHDAALQFICKFCPNVRVLNCQVMLGAIGMGHVVKWRKTLTHLTVTMVEAQEDFSVLGAECQSLSELTICSNGQVCASSWSRFFEVCAPTLRKVSSTLPFDDLICGIIAARCPLLEELDLPTMSNATMVALANGCPKLRTLKMGHCCGPDLAGVSAIAQNGALTHLWVARSSHVSNEVIHEVAVHCRHLQHVSFVSTPLLNDSSLAVLGQNCPQLRSCRFEDLNISQEGLQSLAVGCLMLEELRVLRCRAVGPALQAIPLNCPHLRVFLIPEVAVAARMVTLLVERCPRLEKVRVSGREIGDTEVTLLITQCAKLTHLDVRGTSVTSLGARTFSLQSKALKYLVVSWVADPCLSPGHGASFLCVKTQTAFVSVNQLRGASKHTHYQQTSDGHRAACDW